jgi:hypothetical protein
VQLGCSALLQVQTDVKQKFFKVRKKNVTLPGANELKPADTEHSSIVMA